MCRIDRRCFAGVDLILGAFTVSGKMGNLRMMRHLRVSLFLTILVFLLVSCAANNSDNDFVRNLAPVDVVPSWSITGYGDLPGSGTKDDPFVFYDTGKPVGDWQGVVMTGVVDDPSGVAAGHVGAPMIYNGVTTGSKAQQWFSCEPMQPSSEMLVGLGDLKLANSTLSGDGPFESQCVLPTGAPAGNFLLQFILVDAQGAPIQDTVTEFIIKIIHGTAKDHPDCELKNILSWDCPTWKRCVGDTAEHFNRFRARYPLVEYVTEGEDCY